MSNTQNWAVVCGAIRSDLEFAITINSILDLREDGLLSGIVVSTWNHSFKDKQKLKYDLIDKGIHVVEVPDLKNGENGQTYRQHRLFDAGLSVCPENSGMLKLRSDKAAHRLDLFKSRLTKGIAPSGGEDPVPESKVFEGRVSVQACSMTMPFNHSDIVF